MAKLRISARQSSGLCIDRASPIYRVVSPAFIDPCFLSSLLPKVLLAWGSYLLLTRSWNYNRLPSYFKYSFDRPQNTHQAFFTFDISINLHLFQRFLVRDTRKLQKLILQLRFLHTDGRRQHIRGRCQEWGAGWGGQQTCFGRTKALVAVLPKGTSTDLLYSPLAVATNCCVHPFDRCMFHACPHSSRI